MKRLSPHLDEWPVAEELPTISKLSNQMVCLTGTTDAAQLAFGERLMLSTICLSVCHAWTQRHVEVSGPQLRVLIVDDNSNSAHALAAYLSLENMECRLAYGGVEAVAVGTDWTPDVIIMDISMPGCSGFEATFAPRHDPRTCNVVIVAFTALDEAEVRKHLADQEFDGYCQKGQTPANLVGLVTGFTR
jgi:two-component system, OmpR family, response regulator